MHLFQSNAILRYIARKHDMLGKTEEERVRVDIMGEQSMDFRDEACKSSLRYHCRPFKLP